MGGSCNLTFGFVAAVLSRYRVKASIHGGDVKDLFKAALKGAQKKAQYPGFRCVAIMSIALL